LGPDDGDFDLNDSGQGIVGYGLARGGHKAGVGVHNLVGRALDGAAAQGEGNREAY
jgi:hypothetical protein